VGITVMTMGVGLFGTLAGYIANKLLSAPPEDVGSPDTSSCNPEMAEIRDILYEQARETSAIRERLDRIEQQIAGKKE